MGIKHCQYLCDRKNILCTLKIEASQEGFQVWGIPVNKKLPYFQVVDSPSITNLDFSQRDLLEKYQHTYLWSELLCWNYEDELPRGRITGTFDREYKTPEVEGEVLLH